MLDRVRYTIHRAKKRLLWPLRRRFPVFVNQLDDPRQEKVLCRCCTRLVPFYAWHLGFSGFLTISCDRCPDVLIVDDEARFPYGAATTAPTASFGKNWEASIRTIDSTLPRCACGGTFAFMNPPRCPHCFGLPLGDLYEGKPILKVREGYSFVPRRAFRLHELEPRTA